MTDNENRFLENAFKNFNSNEKLDSGFNKAIIQKIEYRNENKALVYRFFMIFIPVFVVCVSGLITLILYKGNAIFLFLSGILPAIKPWHVFLAVCLIYFHFVRSILILAFLYLKKHFNFVFSFN